MEPKRGLAVITVTGLGALLTALTLSAAPLAEGGAALDAARATALRPSLLALPLGFEPNVGQVNASVRFLSRARGASLYLTPADATLVLHHGPSAATVRMTLVGADPQAPMAGTFALPGTVSYLRGSDPSRWRTRVPTFSQVRVHGAWPGIDLVHRGNGGELEHDFVVAPGADPCTIRVAYPGSESLRIDAAGDLVLATAAGTLVEHAPVIYQEGDGGRSAVAGRFVLVSEREIGFEVGDYDRERELVIDPVLAYSSYLGGSGEDGAAAIAVDGAGNVYLTGRTTSVDFPVTGSAFDLSLNGDADIYVAKLDASGASLLYSTYIGGSYIGSSNETPFGIAVDDAGNAFVTGRTYSSDFPTTPGAFDNSRSGTLDAFVLKLDPTGGALVYSTYLGGSIGAAGPALQASNGIAIDSAGNAYVAGWTSATDFPTTPGAFDRSFNLPHGKGDPGHDGFVTKLNPAGSALVYSTFLGGDASDDANGIAVDASGNAFVSGYTISSGFPVTSAAYDRTYNGSGDAFITKLNPAGSALVYSTYLGGSAKDGAATIAIDGSGNALAGGSTASTGFPTTAGAFDRTLETANDGFVTKLNPAGSALVYSTFLGGNGADTPRCIAVDAASGAAFVGGQTASSNFPTTPDAFSPTRNGNLPDAFVTQFSATGALLYSTYLGGTDYDEVQGMTRSGNRVFLAGWTSSSDLPLAGNPLQPVHLGFSDAFVAWFDF